MNKKRSFGRAGFCGCAGWMIVAIVFTMLCGAEKSNAQRYLGAIGGEVSDNTRAIVVGASVTAVATATQFTTSVVTGKDGTYLMPALQPDTYRITVTAAGFKGETRTNVVVTAGQAVEMNITLTPGAVTQTIQVTATNSSLMDTSSPDIATTLSTQQVTDLPNIGRNAYELTLLAPGVVGGGNADVFVAKVSTFATPFGAPMTSTATDGSLASTSSTGHNRLFLDGIPNDVTERLIGPEYIGVVPSPEAIQEVKVENGTFDAEIGHGDGFVTNTVLRTGTNQLHGATYYVFQNTYLNANVYQNAGAGIPRGNDQLSQTGLVLDGPVYIPKLYNGHNKTFFMFAFERYQSHSSTAYTARVPTANELKGDFSALCSSFNTSGLCTSGVQLYDPLSPVDANGNRTTYFPNNNIASRINATGAALATYLPGPNVPGATALTSINYISPNGARLSTYPSYIGRLDQSIGQRNKLSVVGFSSGLTQPTILEGFPKNIGPTGDAYVAFRNNWGGSLDDVQQLSDTMVLDSRLGGIYHPFGLVYNESSGFDLTSLGMTTSGLPYNSFPGTSMNSDGYASLAPGASGSQISETTQGSLSEVLSKIWGRHSVRFGWEGDVVRLNVEAPLSGFGAFNFDRMFTQQNVNAPVGSEANSGDPMASMLLGYFSSDSYSIQIAYALQQIYQAGFVQDDWRVNDKLTVNLGMRWDYEAPNTERYNRLNSNFCTTCANPMQASVPSLPLNGGLEFANSSDRFAWPRDLNNWQPRLGAEYALRPNTVVRAGFGIIYFNTMEPPFATGYSQTTSYTNTTNGAQPINSETNPFPTGVIYPSGTSLGLSTGIGQAVNFNDPNRAQPRTYTGTIDVQQRIAGNFTVQVGYVGARPNRLDVSHNINFLPAQYYNLGPSEVTYLNSKVANPMAGYIPGNATLNGSTIQQQYLLLPYPEFSTVTENYSSIGSTDYNSLQIQVSHPMSHRFTLQGNFTWSRTVDHIAYLNPFDTKLASYQDYGANILANVFGTLRLPGFESRPYWQRQILGGWELNSVLYAGNGRLIPAPSGVNIIGPVTQAHRTNARFINTCYENTSGQLVMSTPSAPACDALSPTPAYEQRLAYTSQSNSPYLPVRALVHPRVDASLFKQFPIREGMTFEIRGEFFNLLNTPNLGVANYGGPSTALGSSTWGEVQPTQANDPRIGQLTARLNF